MSKPSRSQFIQKLHETLQHGRHPEDLHWVSRETFEITVDDARARAALSQSWDFRSLSSFIRQLSYYGFKRLSDRRRSVERRAHTASAFIVFSHPSGFFVQGDNSNLDRIVRKTRARKSVAAGGQRARKNSSASSDMSQSEAHGDHYDDDHRGPMLPHLPPFDAHRHWTAPAPPPGRMKPNLHLPLAFSTLDWDAHRGSPYPTPLQGHSPHYSPASYQNAQSYFQYPSAATMPVAGGGYIGAEHLVGRQGVGAIGAPPSPSDSFGSQSPRGSDHDEHDQEYFANAQRQAASHAAFVAGSLALGRDRSGEPYPMVSQGFYGAPLVAQDTPDAFVQPA